MAKFLIQASYTHEGVRGLQSAGGSSRRAAVEDALETVGGKLESFHFGFGDHDAYVIAEMGLDQHFTFPSTTGTDYHPPGRRGVPADERPPEDEPPHLQLGSPHENEPAPYDPSPKEVL